jgi:hypothetical protein
VVELLRGGGIMEGDEIIGVLPLEQINVVLLEPQLVPISYKTLS